MYIAQFVYFMLPYTALLFFRIRTNSRVSKEGEQWAKFGVHCFTPWVGNRTGTRGHGPSPVLEEYKNDRGWEHDFAFVFVVPAETLKVLADHTFTQIQCGLQKDKPPKIRAQTGTDGILLCPSPHCSHFGKQLEL